MFNNFKEVENGEYIFMGNSASSDVKDKENFIMKIKSRKEITLRNVSFVPYIRRNLVSESLLNKHGSCLVFEDDKFVLTKNGVFMGIEYDL